MTTQELIDGLRERAYESRGEITRNFLHEVADRLETYNRLRVRHDGNTSAYETNHK